MIAAGAIVCALSAEALLAYALAELLAAGYAPGNRDAVNAVTFLLIALVAYGHLRLAGWFGLARRETLVLMIGVPFVTLYGALRIEFAGDIAIWDFRWMADFLRNSSETARDGEHALVGATLLTALWVRSARRSDGEIDLETLPRVMGIPFALATVILITGAGTARSAEISRAVVAFYAAGLLALALSQLALSGATFGDVRAGGTVGLLAAGIVGAAVIGVSVVVLVFSFIGPIVGPPFNAVVTHVLTWVITPPAWLLEHLFRALLGGNDPLQNLTPDLQRELREAQPGPDGEDSPARAIGKAALRMLGLILVVGAVALAVAAAARVRRRTRSQGAGHESSPAGSLGDDLGQWLRSLGKRRSNPAGARTATGVYALYAEVLTRAEDRGRVRAPAETPREFAPSLRAAFQGSVTDEITDAFQHARYGGHDPDPALVESLRSRWHQVGRSPED